MSQSGGMAEPKLRLACTNQKLLAGSLAQWTMRPLVAMPQNSRKLLIGTLIRSQSPGPHPQKPKGRELTRERTGSRATGYRPRAKSEASAKVRDHERIQDRFPAIAQLQEQHLSKANLQKLGIPKQREWRGQLLEAASQQTYRAAQGTTTDWLTKVHEGSPCSATA